MYFFHYAPFTKSYSNRPLARQAHDAAVTKLTWAHPEFGSIIASASFDRTVRIWEETMTEAAEQPQVNGSAQNITPSSRWVERAMNTDAKGSVRAVEFAPHQLGLKLVRAIVCSAPYIFY